MHTHSPRTWFDANISTALACPCHTREPSGHLERGLQPSKQQTVTLSLTGDNGKSSLGHCICLSLFCCCQDLGDADHSPVKSSRWLRQHLLGLDPEAWTSLVRTQSCGWGGNSPQSTEPGQGQLRVEQVESAASALQRFLLLRCSPWGGMQQRNGLRRHSLSLQGCALAAIGGS